MDFAIFAGSGKADMTWIPATSLLNNVWLSLHIRRGSFFAAPNFGMRPVNGKNTARTEALVKEYAAEALQWLLDTGRATEIELSTTRDTQRWPNRILLSGAVVQASGRRLPFEQFVELI